MSGVIGKWYQALHLYDLQLETIQTVSSIFSDISTIAISMEEQDQSLIQGLCIDVKSEGPKIELYLECSGCVCILCAGAEIFAVWFTRAQENAYPGAFLRFSMVYLKGPKCLWNKICNGADCSTFKRRNAFLPKNCLCSLYIGYFLLKLYRYFRCI